MTGVQSAQVLGPTTQKQADRSRAEIEGDAPAPGQGGRDESASSGFSDGGRDELERNNGVDVIR
ncbi:MAG: cell division protein FtsZ, partial [Haloferacaceae archaeon]